MKPAINLLVVVLGIFIGWGSWAIVESGPVKTWQTRHEAQGYIRTHSVRKLQIGAGGNDPPGWFNTDIKPSKGESYLDATKPFPLPAGSIDYIFSEHVIEHLTYEDGLAMLRESRRVLAPGGKVRVITPDLRKLVGLFQDSKSPESQRYIDGKLAWHGWLQTTVPEVIILNYELRGFDHQFVYDSRLLRNSLEQAGFVSIKEYSPGASDDPQLMNIEGRPHATFAAVSEYESMVLQAARP